MFVFVQGVNHPFFLQRGKSGKHSSGFYHFSKRSVICFFYLFAGRKSLDIQTHFAANLFRNKLVIAGENLELYTEVIQSFDGLFNG